MQRRPPAVVYAEAHRQRSSELARLKRRDLLIANLRLVVAALGVLAVWLCLLTRVLPWGWLLPPVVLFVGLVSAGHSRVTLAGHVICGAVVSTTVMIWSAAIMF